MSAPTRGLSWVPAPVPGTTDRYSVEPHDAYDGAERYRLALTYDQACEVARLLDEADGRAELEDLGRQLDEALDRNQDLESDRDDLTAEVEDLKQRVRELEDECERAENDAEDLRQQLIALDSRLANS